MQSTHYAIAIGFALLCQLQKAHRTALEGYVQDLRPFSRCTPKVAKLHSAIIQMVGDFTTNLGDVNVLRIFDFDFLMTSVAKMLLEVHPDERTMDTAQLT